MKKVLFKTGKTIFSCFIIYTFLLWSTGLSAQCTMSCNDTLRISLDEDCISEVTAAMMLEDPSGCPGPKIVTIMDPGGAGVLAGSPWVNSAHIGMSFQVKTQDVSSGNSCWGVLIVEDKLPPVVNCTDITVSCGSALNPAIVGSPTASDNCDGNVSLTWMDISNTPLGCTSSNIAVISRRWIGVDNWSNADTCFQSIYIRKATLNDVDPPHNYDDQDLPALNCANANTSIANTGQPTVDGFPIASICNLMVLHSDIPVSLCYNSYKLLRTWTIMDNCTGQSVNYVQVIKVLDKTGPVMACPADITIGTNSNNCFGNLQIPALLSLSDNCSDAAHISVSVNGPGTHVANSLLNIPLGMHFVTYTATDGCANSNTCSFKVTVVDDDQPLVVCDENTVVTLQPDGTAIVYAPTFDDGSHDNCGIADYLVKRMDDNGPFLPSVEFNCDDDLVLVIMRVYDIHGNYNDCMVSVNVDDKEDPVLLCPADITIECGDDYNNLYITGTATATDNCGFIVTQSSYENLDNCGEGYIVRTWTATDPSGNETVCHQHIYLEDSDPFDAGDIIWPPDYEVYECAASLDPDNLPAPYNRPVVNDDQCSLIAMAYEDLYFDIAEPACYKIVRTWTVVDWCQFTPQGGGIWTQNQILKVFDNTAPVITCPGDTIVYNQTVNCGIYVNIPPATATDCSYILTFSYTVDKNNDGTIELAGPGPNASGVYENGVYKITFTVEDNCGNIDYCDFLLTVVDAKKPAVVCLYGVAAELMLMDSDGNGTPDAQIAQVWDTELIQSMSDNCTPADQLRLRVRRTGTGTGVPTDHVVTFDCSDIGTQPVEVWVGDNADNWDYCETFVEVQDNMGICGPTATAAMVSGGIVNTANAGVEEVTVVLAGSSMPAFTTPASGNYQFMGVPLNDAYTIVPQRDNDPTNGVTTYDIVLITKHILGIAPFNTPYKMLAADVNRSGSITAFDLVQLRQLILGVITELPNNTSWRFVRSDYQFLNPANPFMEDIPEVGTLDNLSADAWVNFTAFKVGDVNESASPNAWIGEEDRNTSGTLQLLVPDKEIQAGETVMIPFYAEGSEIAAYQFTLNYDPLKMSFVESRAGLLGVEASNFGVFEDKGALTSSWNASAAVPAALAAGSLNGESAAKAAGTAGTPWFYLVFKANENIRLSEVLTLNSRITTAVAYDSDGAELGMSLTFEAGETVVETAVFELYQNEPNPFLQSTTIGFHLPYSTTAAIRLFDANGRLIREMNGPYSKGYHQVTLDKGAFPSEGVYFYQLETPEFTATKRMVFIN
jgi:hypothetical protein